MAELGILHSPDHAPRKIKDFLTIENLYIFEEIQGVYAFLLYKNLDVLLIGEDKLTEKNSLFIKYLSLIKELRPNLKVISKDFEHISGEYEKAFYYPKIETIFNKGELKSLYQPIIRQEGERKNIIGFECLSRLIYKNTYYPPEILFRYAEEKLKVKDYDQICLWQALVNAPLMDDLLVFINVRPPTLMDNDFLPWLINLLKTIHQEPKNIVVEITEQHGSILPEQLQKKTDQLKKAGFKLALDDFGTGMSNLILLETLSPDFIKICGELIKGIHANRFSNSIVKHLLLLARELNINAVLEAVEEKEDWQCLYLLGSRFAQGYHFYKPQEKHDLCDILCNFSKPSQC